MCKTVLKKISPWQFLLSLAVICAGVLIAAHILEHFFGVLPCQMCLYERNVFILTGVLAFLSFLLPRRFQYIAIFGIGFVFMGGALLASYHVAVQQHWVDLPAFCAVNDFSAFDTVEALREQMLQTPFVRCDKVTWSLFGLSLAAYNVLLSLFLALSCWVWGWAHR